MNRLCFLGLDLGGQPELYPGQQHLRPHLLQLHVADGRLYSHHTHLGTGTVRGFSGQIIPGFSGWYYFLGIENLKCLLQIILMSLLLSTHNIVFLSKCSLEQFAGLNW